MEKQEYLIIISALFTAVVFVFTVLFALAIPATKGYWNVGEVGVYLAAFIGGPIVGAVAGGIGSALADIFLGYAYYAPGTLIIKGVEGYVAGFLFWRMKDLVVNEKKKLLALGFVALFFVVIVLSYVYVFSSANLSSIEVQLSSEPLGWSISFVISPWIFVGFILVLEGMAIIFVLTGREELLMVFSALIAGTFMVFGYFLYEILLYGSSVALIEVIPNYFQVVAGIIISVPVVRRLERLGVIDKYREFVGQV